MNIWDYFNQALIIATAKSNDRDFIMGAIALRKDGTKVASANGPVIVPGVKQRAFFSNAHAESRLCRKIDKGSVVFVIRVGKKDGKFKLRKMTPIEHFRFMGFRDGEIDLGDMGYADLCRCAGNGWDVNVASKIMENIGKLF